MRPRAPIKDLCFVSRKRSPHITPQAFPEPNMLTNNSSRAGAHGILANGRIFSQSAEIP